MDEARLLDHAARTIVERVVRARDQAKPQLLEAVAQHLVRRLGHAAPPPCRARERIAQHEAVDVAPLRIADEADRPDARPRGSRPRARLLEDAEHMRLARDHLHEHARVLARAVRGPSGIGPDGGVAAVGVHVVDIVGNERAQHEALGLERRALPRRHRQNRRRTTGMPRLAGPNASREPHLVEHPHARLAQGARRHAVTGHELAGERAVVHEAASARRALRLEHGQLAPLLLRQLHRLGGSDQKRVRDVDPVRVRHAQRALGGGDLAGGMRHRQPAQHLGAHGNHLASVVQLQHVLAGTRLPIVAARLPQQACAHGYRHRSSSFRRKNPV